ncbi:MAG: hypothetical protein LBS21_12200 [Clostridiales bacterium]|nr:hypothetical protein [Clostridiales bacterium]
MERPNTHDERVLAHKRKINSEAYGILMIVLLASILVQQFLLDAPFEQYAVEILCFFGMSIYMIVRHITLGIDMHENEKRATAIPLLNSIVAGITVTVINGVLNFVKYGERYKETGAGVFAATLVFTFIGTTIFAFAVLSCVKYLNGKRQAQILKRLDEDERNSEL